MYKFEKFVLDNGLRLIVSPTDHNEIALWLFIKGGSQHEKKEESGISHFIEHMLFRGTERWPTYKLIDEKTERISQENGAHTDLEETSYFLRVQPRYFNEALDLLSDWASAPLLRQVDIDKEKEIVPEEIRKDLDIPEKYVQWELWHEVCFGDQPAGWSICGTEETIRTFSEGQIKKFFEKTYVGSRMLLVIAGDIKHKAVLEKVKKAFGGVKPGKLENPFSLKNQQKNPRSFVFYKDTQQTHFVLGFKTPFGPGTMESYATDVLANILRHNIYITLIGDKGMLYSTVTDNPKDSTKSFIRSYAGVGHNKAEEAILSIMGEYKKMAQGNIEVKEADRAVRRIVRGMRTSFSMDPLDLVNFFGTQELFAGNISTPREVFKIYESLKIKYLREIAKTIFIPANLNLAIIGPHTNQEKFQKLIEKF